MLHIVASRVTGSYFCKPNFFAIIHCQANKSKFWDDYNNFAILLVCLGHKKRFVEGAFLCIYPPSGYHPSRNSSNSNIIFRLRSVSKSRIKNRAAEGWKTLNNSYWIPAPESNWIDFGIFIFCAAGIWVLFRGEFYLNWLWITRFQIQFIKFLK